MVTNSKHTKNKKNSVNLEDDEKGGARGDGGEGGKGRGGKGGSGYIPTFDDLIAVSPEEADIARWAKDALFNQRVTLKSQGEKVDALDKRQELRKRMSDPNIANDLSGGGSSGLEKHPELPETGGAFDDVVLPEVEAAEAAANDPQLSNQLRNRLGMGMSAEAIRYDLEKKNKEKLKMSTRAPEPEPRPQYVMRPAEPPPRPRPAGF